MRLKPAGINWLLVYAIKGEHYFAITFGPHQRQAAIRKVREWALRRDLPFTEEDALRMRDEILSVNRGDG